MPKVRDKITNEVVAELPYDETGESQAEQMVQGNPNLEIDYAPGGTYDAGGRVEKYHFGGQTPGQPGFGEKPIVNPLSNPGGLPKMAGNIYENGGKVNNYKKK
tara:strand:- start:188 stop:496 length:309 start_codon:yes stop_codon:yes gene_type:complete